jgi:hypothetical protein
MSARAMSQPQPAANPSRDTSALVLGILALIFWLLPVAGVPISICGLVQGVRAWRSAKRRKALTAIILSALGLLLAITYAAAGLYVGLHAPRAQ